MKNQLFGVLRKPYMVMVVAVSIISCKKNGGDTAPIVPPVKPAKVTYSLVWADEFDGNKVDTAKWVFENRDAGVNNEQEYYLIPNVSVSDGKLVIVAKKENYGGKPYTSGKITTYGKFTQQYGRIEAKISMPLGKGMWPAFWMMGANVGVVNWPTCGEIDIMEHVNDDNDIYGTMHWNNQGHVSYGGSTATTTSPDNYHIYAVEWDASTIKWYVDDTLYVTGHVDKNNTGTDAFHLPFFLILNLAVGGDFPGQIIDESKMPAKMYVDYVRVYKAN